MSFECSFWDNKVNLSKIQYDILNIINFSNYDNFKNLTNYEKESKLYKGPNFETLDEV